MTEADIRAPDIADLAATAALAVPGVSGLHGGEFGTVATYLPGRRITGISIGADACAVHVILRYPADLIATADRVRDAVRAVVGVPVDVTIEDLTDDLPHDETGPRT
ncbi:hypothetical protein [Prescottella equi]|uniref:Asp23/Gls24 family envelope stress response protein n=1 Tax=Rhodococcus hoagii (strain 103S) TaxID=685727 RepID=A0A3S5YAQ2_RHOH1|nr:hypothetical protein [Prescottella equi]MBM4475599.1 hypothetical protein [Prescottella equi]CBH49627.1 hypothetical protein REQ_36390 [Prescottella equi 103S]